MKPLLSFVGNPWDYLNGTKQAFGIDAGNANTVVTAIFLLIRDGALTVATILILASISGILFSKTPQEKAAGKKGLRDRFIALVLIGTAPGVLTLFMKICNLFFGIK